MLQLILDYFRWQRPPSRKKGFTWEGTGEERRLVCAPGVAFNSYRPHPGLFGDFAACEPTPEAVLTFANRYGALRQRLELNTLACWREGIHHLKKLVKLSDAVTVGDWKMIPKALAPFLADPSLANAADLRPLRQRQKRGENLSHNEQAHAAVIRLYHALWPAERLEVEGSWNPRSGHVDVRLKHADLLAFMFYQLGHALIGGRRFRQCAVCGKWSLLAPGVNRADRTTCSGYCRLKRYRQRQAKAVELRRSGWSLQKIAQEIGSEVATVKKWLAAANG